MLTPPRWAPPAASWAWPSSQPGERIGEHYHPYSEEFVYVVSGALEVDLDGETHAAAARQGLMIPIDMRHRFRNVGSNT